MKQVVKDTKGITWQEYLEKHPEIKKEQEKKKHKGKFKWACQCKNGHIFDYRERTRYQSNHFAPCQGKCPECGATFSFIGTGNNVFPIRFC